MNLLKKLKNKVSDKIYKRGQRYYKAGNIIDYNIVPIDGKNCRIEALVMGTKDYDVDVDIKIKGKEMDFYGGCTCPYWGGICKHEVAVIYKFIKEDYKNIDQIIDGNGDFNKLVQLVHRSKGINRSNLIYWIKGLSMQNMVNFKLTLASEDLIDSQLESLIAYLHNFSPRYNRSSLLEEYLPIKDQINLSYFKGIEISKSPTLGALFFPKNRDNFNFLVNLIRNNEVYLEETGQRAVLGEDLKPDLFIKGDQNEVELKFAYKHDIHGKGGAEWFIIGSSLHKSSNSLDGVIPERIEIPKEGRGKFLFEVLPQLENSFHAHLPPPLKDYKLSYDRTDVEIEFDYQEDIISCKAELKMGERTYQNSEIIGFDLHNKKYRQDEDNPKLWYSDDTEQVKDLLAFLEEYNFHVKPDRFYIKDNDDIQEFITEGVINLPQEWEVKTSQSFEELEVLEVELNPIIDFEERKDGIDWFEFSISYRLGDRTYSRQELEKLLKYNKHNNKYLQVDNKYFLLHQSPQEDNLKKMIEGTQEDEDGRYRSNYYNLLYYQSLMEDGGISFKGDKVYDQLNKDITGDRLVKEEEIPAGISDTLREYQKKGYYWMRFLHKYSFGGILADDMGLGKTLQALTLLKSIDSKTPSLIVCPRTLIYNWAAEIDKFFPGTKYLVYYGTPKEREKMRGNLSDYEIVVTTYSIMSRDHEDINDLEVDFSYTILDEAHHIKNRRTQRTKGIKKVKSRYKLALTGTPLENSLDELWSIFDFLMPGYLGKYGNFRKKYLNPIVKDDDKDKLKDIKMRIAPFILRRKKEEVLDDLPEKMVNIYPVEMSKFQEETYSAVVEEVKKELAQRVEEEGFNKSQINVLAALTKLRQICNHPNLILKDEKKSRESGKLEALLEIIEEATLAGHKLIVFSQFVGMLKLIRERLEEDGVSFEYLDGSTRNRMKRVDNFNRSSDIKVFLISLKAGGVGLNLTSADTVIHVDPWWNPMVERQATDRAHRIGQKKKVIVYKLITTGTVEEKMIKLQEKKEDIFENVIEDNARPTEKVTWEDIQQLLE